jgi:hypothetical protein
VEKLKKIKKTRRKKGGGLNKENGGRRGEKREAIIKVKE